MERPPLFFDLDGPLLDVRARYYGVYARIAADLEIPPLSPGDYWEAKRRQAPLAEFFPGAPSGEALRRAYLDRWLAWIERPEWLARDSLVVAALACLDALRPWFALYLVTLRREPAALQAQLAALELRGRFAGVFSGWSETDGSGLKARWIQPLLGGGRSVLVGDSEVDAEAARRLGLQFIGVSFGIRPAADLIRRGADPVVDDLPALTRLLLPAAGARGESSGPLPSNAISTPRLRQG